MMIFPVIVCKTFALFIALWPFAWVTIVITGLKLAHGGSGVGVGIGVGGVDVGVGGVGVAGGVGVGGSGVGVGVAATKTIPLPAPRVVSVKMGFSNVSDPRG